MSDTTARDMFVTAVRAYAAVGLNSAPMSDWFDTVSGTVQGFRARPVIGGHLALVSYLEFPCRQRWLDS